MVKLRLSAERGHADHGWLDTYHSFSFAEYHDRQHMGFRALRVLNEDRVAGGGGFGRHPHQDFEIISYVVSGELKHQDSLGHEAVMRTGDVQRISAGTGISHSEFNNSPTAPVHFLQIWLQPALRGFPPNYAEKSFASAAQDALTLLCSQAGSNGSLTINRDVDVYLGKIAAGKSLHLPLRAGRAAWVQLIAGRLEVNGVALAAGDGAAYEEEPLLELKAPDNAQFLAFDLD